MYKLIVLNLMYPIYTVFTILLYNVIYLQGFFFNKTYIFSKRKIIQGIDIRVKPKRFYRH